MRCWPRHLPSTHWWSTPSSQSSVSSPSSSSSLHLPLTPSSFLSFFSSPLSMSSPSSSSSSSTHDDYHSSASLTFLSLSPSQPLCPAPPSLTVTLSLLLCSSHYITPPSHSHSFPLFLPLLFQLVSVSPPSVSRYFFPLLSVNIFQAAFLANSDSTGVHDAGADWMKFLMSSYVIYACTYLLLQRTTVRWLAKPPS